MEPPRGFLASLWNFIRFLPYFIGLLILGFIKGIAFCPVICLIVTIGNSAIILGLWPVHLLWTNYCIIRSKKLGPVLKIVLCLCISVLLIISPVIGIVGSIIGGAAYGLLAPVFATFNAVGKGKTNEVFHSIFDGTLDTVKESFTIVRDFLDVCYHSYFSVMDDLLLQEGKYYEIRLLDIPLSILAGVLGFVVDLPVVSLVALYKSPYMLCKGWLRLFHDCIGREGPFLETICVPFAGLAILLWPLAVVGAVLGSMASSIFLGSYAAVVVYQESSLWLGLCYIVASLSIYDEYSNDILDMREGSCFPRPRYRRQVGLSETGSLPTSLNPPSRAVSMKGDNGPMVELRPFELLDSLIKDCRQIGETVVAQGLITLKDIEDAKSNKDSGSIMSIGLPAYCLLQCLIRSVNANSPGLLLNDNVTEITSSNRPKDAFFDWFLNPLLILKDQIKAENLSDAEEDYLGKLVLLSGNPERMKDSSMASPPESELKRAELDALARRLRGIMKSISIYPTFRRRFEDSLKTIYDDLAKKNGSSRSVNGRPPVRRTRSAFDRIFSQKSFKYDSGGSYQGPRSAVEREIDIV